MSYTDRKFGTPVDRVLIAQSKQVVGYVYEWDNGDQQIMWLHGNRPEGDVVCEDGETLIQPC